MQAKEGGQNFLHGALILAASALIVKLIGAFFKVPLANIIGGSGMGYFMTAYDFFNPVRSLAVAGIPVAVSKMVSEAVATGRFADARRTFRAALGLMCITGVLGTVGVFAFGESSSPILPEIPALRRQFFPLPRRSSAVV
ncbi:MAG: oligosaccharide flippase family protein [Acutalibacteraceae bacterium]